MAMVSHKKEQFLSHNTLAVLLMAVVGRSVSIQLKNESVVRGRLEAVDAHSNLTMSNVQLQNVQGRRAKASIMHVKASAICFVQLPDNVDPSRAIQGQLNQFANQRRQPKKLV